LFWRPTLTIAQPPSIGEMPFVSYGEVAIRLFDPRWRALTVFIDVNSYRRSFPFTSEAFVSKMLLDWRIGLVALTCYGILAACTKTENSPPIDTSAMAPAPVDMPAVAASTDNHLMERQARM
jgi:hypothetical protein